MVLSPGVRVFALPREQSSTHAVASPRDGLFEELEVEHENLRDYAHKDREHNVRYQACALRNSVYAIERLHCNLVETIWGIVVAMPCPIPPSSSVLPKNISFAYSDQVSPTNAAEVRTVPPRPSSSSPSPLQPGPRISPCFPHFVDNATPPLSASGTDQHKGYRPDCRR